MEKKSKLVQSQSMMVLNQLLEFSEARLGITANLHLNPGFSGSIQLSLDGTLLWKTAFDDMTDALNQTRSFFTRFVTEQVEGMNDKIATKIAETKRAEEQRQEWVELAEQVQRGEFSTEGEKLNPPIKNRAELEQLNNLAEMMKLMQYTPASSPFPLNPNVSQGTLQYHSPNPIITWGHTTTGK